MKSEAGFTLVELVITIALSTIVISFMSIFVSGPVTAYNDQERRAELVNVADHTLQLLARDVRRALPNSVRVRSNGSVVALEILRSADGGRYRDRPPGNQARRLRFNNSDGSFNTIGSLQNIAKPFSSTSHYLSIYNVGVSGADAYELANVITPAGTQIDIDADTVTGEDRVTLSPSFRFAFESPAQRVFLVEGPVTYLCDTSSGIMTRYFGYSIASSQASRDSAAELLSAGAGSTDVGYNLSACAFQYTPGTAERSGLLSLSLTLTDSGENITLLRQVHVDNVP